MLKTSPRDPIISKITNKKKPRSEVLYTQFRITDFELSDHELFTEFRYQSIIPKNTVTTT